MCVILMILGLILGLMGVGRIPGKYPVGRPEAKKQTWWNEALPSCVLLSFSFLAYFLALIFWWYT